ncbi:hypothetical protein T01_4173 [Trichinella spiralis]|uniref:Uncharacterized protein n=1 Tax=Trichinella spiralis TaxID=6334 RepID=A0A0V0ZZF6_TRISP|nr:hypothetical protein T01_4173 [Trichinella spiralis]
MFNECSLNISRYPTGGRRFLKKWYHSLLDPGSEPFDIAQLFECSNNGNECFGCT